ncbi:helix-turn-helix domain-containing protein [Listeria booriae]|uniref:helix-turn-helix domain-containing protein n=1 Tax=Listeria booriae TaxID=1552123 RepID=UPI00164DEE10|nr:helix-turn-helix transcriptional regulator [Listeria booriae]MBC6165745.1 helix-turn-helix domain-containing protein [Listeria booriae]
MSVSIFLKNKVRFNHTVISSGRSFRSLSAEAGLSSSTIYPILNSDKRISPRVAKKICDTLKLDFDELFEIKEDER